MSTKPRDALGLHLDVPALRPARQRSGRRGARFLVERHDLVAQPVGPFGREGAFEADDAVAVQATHDVSGFECLIHPILPSSCGG